MASQDVFVALEFIFSIKNVLFHSWLSYLQSRSFVGQGKHSGQLQGPRVAIKYCKYSHSSNHLA